MLGNVVGRITKYTLHAGNFNDAASGEIGKQFGKLN